jgi:hypothetical protein
VRPTQISDPQALARAVWPNRPVTPVECFPSCLDRIGAFRIAPAHFNRRSQRGAIVLPAPRPVRGRNLRMCKAPARDSPISRYGPTHRGRFSQRLSWLPIKGRHGDAPLAVTVATPRSRTGGRPAAAISRDPEFPSTLAPNQWPSCSPRSLGHGRCRQLEQHELVAEDLNFVGGVDCNDNFVTANLRNHDVDIVADQNPFTGLARECQHDHLLPHCGTGPRGTFLASRGNLGERLDPSHRECGRIYGPQR